jgi:glycosyltransferase involved in cell wall biosynthesis
MPKPSGDSADYSLFLSPEAPFPAVGGGALRSASLLTYLGKLNPVDRILFRQPGENDPASEIPKEIPGESFVIPLPHHRKDLWSRSMRNGIRAVRGKPPLIDRFSGFSGEMARFLEGRSYRLGVIEHFWCAQYLSQLRLHCDEVWLDLHNLESVLQERESRYANGVQGMAYRRFAQAYRSLERDWYRRFDLVLVTSDPDAAAVRDIAPLTKVIVFPNTIPERSRPARVEENVIVFSGNLAYPPNAEAVRFFARAVWPRLRERIPGLIWRIVGKNPDAVLRYLRGENYIQLSGPVEDAVLELARAKLAVVPILSGSGTRVKILEAWAAATPVVSTTLGAEGLPARDGEQLILADGADGFVETICGLFASESVRIRVGEAGRRLYEERFTWPAGWRTLDSALGGAKAGGRFRHKSG